MRIKIAPDDGRTIEMFQMETWLIVTSKNDMYNNYMQRLYMMHEIPLGYQMELQIKNHYYEN